jgi:hypothetical protein
MNLNPFVIACCPEVITAGSDHLVGNKPGNLEIRCGSKASRSSAALPA